LYENSRAPVLQQEPTTKGPSSGRLDRRHAGARKHGKSTSSINDLQDSRRQFPRENPNLPTPGDISFLTIPLRCCCRDKQDGPSRLDPNHRFQDRHLLWTQFKLDEIGHLIGDKLKDGRARELEATKPYQAIAGMG
jgi:hypothetical protein